jgi:hypothetical protein
MAGHHWVYGTLQDILTAELLPDTDDERIRQQLARLLLKERGYRPQDIEARLVITSCFNGQHVRSLIDLTVSVQEQRLFVLRYGPGSLVTREKAAVAAARVLDPHLCLPLAVVSNGQDAELLETQKARVLATGMEAIPIRTQAELLLAQYPPRPPLTGLERERNLRILNAFDVERCCMPESCKENISDGTL